MPLRRRGDAFVAQDGWRAFHVPMLIRLLRGNLVQYGSSWCTFNSMTTGKASKKTVRRSVSLRPDIDSKVQVLARRERRSANQVIEDLIEAGLETKEAEKHRFFELGNRLTVSTDKAEQHRIKEELARMTFGA